MEKNSKIIALAFSDLHLNDWNKFESRKNTALDILKNILAKSALIGVPALFCGDFFHNPDKISQELFHDLISFKSVVEKEIKNTSKLPKLFAIKGNHDMYHTNSLNSGVAGWHDSFDKIFDWYYPIDLKTVSLYKGVYVTGIPYIDHNKGLNEYLKDIKLPKGKNILLLHTDYPGAKDNDGREIGSVENLNTNLLSKFDLVLCGHIHKPQRLSKKVYMIGAPYQQRRTDRDSSLGYWEIREDLSMTFIPLKDYPKYIDVETPDEVKEDGNYYTVIPKDTRVPISNNHKITRVLSKKSLARKYMREKGIKDKDKKTLLIDILKKSEDLC